jgi:hypothetical protein
MELAMDVPADCYRRVDDLDIGLFDKEFTRFVAELTNSGLWNGFAGAEERNVTSIRDALVLVWGKRGARGRSY